MPGLSTWNRGAKGNKVAMDGNFLQGPDMQAFAEKLSSALPAFSAHCADRLMPSTPDVCLFCLGLTWKRDLLFSSLCERISRQVLPPTADAEAHSQNQCRVWSVMTAPLAPSF